MTVRVATISDHEIVYKFSYKFIETTPYKDLFNDVTLYDLTLETIQDPNSVVLLYEDKGMIAGRVVPFLFGPQLVAAEIGWWVEPEHRKSGTGKVLIKAFEDWAEDQGCEIVIMASLSEELEKFYEKTGYKIVERMYMKELN